MPAPGDPGPAVRDSRGHTARTRRHANTQFVGLRPSPTTFFWTREMQQSPATGGVIQPSNYAANQSAVLTLVNAGPAPVVR